MFSLLAVLLGVVGACTVMLSFWLRPFMEPYAGLMRPRPPSTDPVEDFRIRGAELDDRSPILMIWRIDHRSIETPFLRRSLLAAKIGSVIVLVGGLVLMVFGTVHGDVHWGRGA